MGSAVKEGIEIGFWGWNQIEAQFRPTLQGSFCQKPGGGGVTFAALVFFGVHLTNPGPLP